ncbi:YlbL family protein [Symbiobacterium terraclitae]|uniref:YlbL family protein n=1 Tax=Symbiobacterium terraclitae TaxID=557451 RepID=UPI00315A8939
MVVLWFRQLDAWVRRLFLLSGLVAIVGAVLVYTPTDYYVTAPGAAIDTSRLVVVENGSPHRGRLYMLVVNTQPANLFWYLYAKLDSRAVLETKQEYLGSFESYAEYLDWNQRLMEDSQRTARAVAFELLGYGEGVRSVGARVVGILSDSPVRGILQAGDVITAIGGEPVSGVAALRARLAGYPGGAEVEASVLRDGAQLTLVLPTRASEEAGREGTAVLGITVQEELEFDDDAVPVEIRSGSIFGPSAGLMFTLQIVDQLTPGGLTDRVVAGTGTIEPDGRVGVIGGVQQKVYTAEAAGAELMFVPAGNYADAAAVATRIQVVPVEHVRDALGWLRSDPG